MNRIPVIILLLALVLASCSKQDATPVTPVNNPVDTLAAQRRYTGSFVNGPFGNVSGQAAVYRTDSGWVLALEAVSISNGPDLHVYLSKEIQPSTFLDLGRLQSVAGTQQYNVPGNPDFSQYRYALVHCKQFNHLFGSAELR